MGKTNPTYRELLKDLKSRWTPFRKALRAQDQELFDEIFDKAEGQAQAGSMMVADSPGQSFYMSLLIEQEKEIQNLKQRVTELEEK